MYRKQGWNQVNITDPDSNPGQTRTWTSLIKVEACAKTYISGTTDWFCVISKDYLQEQMVNVWMQAIYINQKHTGKLYS